MKFPSTFWVLWVVFGGLFTFLQSAKAEIQFDVFVGYEDVVRESGWFPVSVEVMNDGPTFEATFEFSNGQGTGGIKRQLILELPTNTRKRFSIPVFNTSGRFSRWDARLIDSGGKVRAEKLAIRTKDATLESVVMGAIPRSFTTGPIFPAVTVAQPEMVPPVVRINPEQLPENPIALDGLSVLYLNSERAADLNPAQVGALKSWINSGGNLILAIEQLSDVGPGTWLQSVLPGTVVERGLVPVAGELDQWLLRGPETESRERTALGMVGKRQGAKSLPGKVGLVTVDEDSAFSAQSMSTLALSNSNDPNVRTVIQGAVGPWVVSKRHGLGLVVLLMFNPEREPFKSWRNKDRFWSKLTGQENLLNEMQLLLHVGGRSVDGVFGAMIHSRQDKKLPWPWLIFILAFYLVVIGPIDFLMLKRKKRQMLTWVTFPSYVLLFTLMIYYIGFRLKSGVVEWNELHVVDVIDRGVETQWRGRTFGSIYSPSNAEYEFGSELVHSGIRGEVGEVWTDGLERVRGRLKYHDKGVRCSIAVPVWSSQMLVSDWTVQRESPMETKIVASKRADRNDGVNVQTVEIRNKLNRPLEDVHLVTTKRIVKAGQIPGGGSIRIEIAEGTGDPTSTFVERHTGNLENTLEQRRRAFGDVASGRIDNVRPVAMAICFMDGLNRNRNNVRQIQVDPWLDRSDDLRKGELVVLAWDSGDSAVSRLNRFNPARGSHDLLYRMPIPGFSH